MLETNINCNPQCMYFPKEKYNYVKYETDEFGIKHSSLCPICGYDGHDIKSWESCKNFRNYTLERKIKQQRAEKSKTEKTIVILGKSSAGKDMLLNELVSRYGFNSIISHTTRPIRVNEEDGKDYFFINKDEFQKMEKQNKFIETRKYKTLLNGKEDIWYYGISKEEFDSKKNRICVVDDIGLNCISNYYGRENIMTVYIDSTEKIRRERAVSRGSFSITEWKRRNKSDDQKFTTKFISDNIDCVMPNNSEKKDLIENIINYLESENLLNAN